MTELIFLAVVALGIVVLVQRQRLRELTRRIERLERGQPLARPAPEPAPVPVRAPAPVPAIAPQPEPVRQAPSPPARPVPVSRPGLESLIGARLPVWIGAIALVAAGFFLVRYSIETGLLGPGVRTILAALFAVLLVAGSESARRLPATRDDPRIAQALAGAGIASAYGTLYIAAALYHLITPLPAFVLMIAVTGLGLVLALRHGPPTAVLALAGGFVAPLVAGYGAAGIGPLLVYLALFTAALYGLAMHRGWAWLALAATAAAFVWVNFLLFALGTDDLSLPAAFVVLLAAGASLALPRAGVTAAWLRLAPLVAGLVQLLAFAPALDFSAFAWALYLVLAAASLILAWRDATYLPGALAALALTLLLLAIGLVEPGSGATHGAAIAAAPLFAAPGLLLLPRARAWAILALGGIAGPLLLANALDGGRLADWQWAAIELPAAALAGWVSWRRRGSAGTRDPGLVGGALLAAVLAGTALGQLTGGAWIAFPFAGIALALGWWAHRTGDTQLRLLPAIALAAILIAGLEPLADYLILIADSANGAHLPYRQLPAAADAFRHLPPALAAAIALLRADSAQFGRLRPGIFAGAVALGLILLYHLAKLPLAIGDEAGFTRWGFGERALITQALLAAGWYAFRRSHPLGLALFGLGLVRILWFDLLLLNPAFVAQQVGSLPLLNAAAIHLALAAAWSWTFAPGRLWRGLGMSLAFATVATAVRQAAHGTLLTGAVTTGENYGYSAAFLLLAIAWLTLGIRTGARDLRIAGLALLTAVTFKVFLIDAAALDGLLRILSFFGLGVALIGIGWVYNRFLAGAPGSPQPSP
ncbi:DUF2339 domain-containing protein [Sphingomonas koreensis]|uniref:DUF2339 domain-containing protein n=1 Tax=Sphingomonas koreensis TaxID=93064 RepID=UPI0008330AC7|nr:DUF2339 domain-containing protein [Sphingomonas koreensis]PJI89086.1 putative membrane protein [Sphingomonas koreensis]RSU63335.1 DUF2339 domain-containing protein [Sphingomonas koreensis]RSU71000.1 DUF2339 domain-containing protein [Sphingomonas koreensis]